MFVAMSTQRKLHKKSNIYVFSGVYNCCLHVSHFSSLQHAPSYTDRLQDPFLNGLLLSEVVAAILVDEKDLIKQVGALCSSYAHFLHEIRL